MGGEQVLGELRERFGDVTAIVSSGYADGPVIASYQDYGFDGVVTKPYNVGRLSRVLADVLGCVPRDGE
jgi:hypothetical protein